MGNQTATEPIEDPAKKRRNYVTTMAVVVTIGAFFAVIAMMGLVLTL